MKDVLQHRRLEKNVRPGADEGQAAVPNKDISLSLAPTPRKSPRKNMVLTSPKIAQKITQSKLGKSPPASRSPQPTFFPGQHIAT